MVCHSLGVFCVGCALACSAPRARNTHSLEFQRPSSPLSFLRVCCWFDASAAVVLRLTFGVSDNKEKKKTSAVLERGLLLLLAAKERRVAVEMLLFLCVFSSLSESGLSLSDEMAAAFCPAVCGKGQQQQRARSAHASCARHKKSNSKSQSIDQSIRRSPKSRRCLPRSVKKRESRRRRPSPAARASLPPFARRAHTPHTSPPPSFVFQGS